MPDKLLKILFLFLCITAAGCKERYEPLPVAADNHYLVVEGFINTNGETSIKLSRTIRLADTARFVTEIGAQVTVEGANNSFFLMQETIAGTYISSQVSLPELSMCRLRILTNTGKVYLSDWVPVKPVPSIDSIYWERTPSGVKTYISTHDASNQTRYYLWQYQEDWEFRSPYNSSLEYINDQLVPRDPNINISRCWQTARSTRIISSTTSHLTNDVILRQPITEVNEGSWLISVKYSVSVTQYPLTREGFEFWEQVRRNSEQLGTIFDPMPSQTAGNIKCVTTPEEPVIGFISAGSTSEKRIFINHAEVLPWFQPMDCPEVFVTPDSVRIYFGIWGYMPEYQVFMPLGYMGSRPVCIDCRLRGSNVKPPFWP